MAGSIINPTLKKYSFKKTPYSYDESGPVIGHSRAWVRTSLVTEVYYEYVLKGIPS